MIAGVGDTTGQEAAVEAAHRAFYAAWERGDAAAALGFWIDADDISCTFPGVPGVMGRDEVRTQLSEGIELTSGIQFLFEDLNVAVRGSVAWLACVENVILPGVLTLEDVVDLPGSQLAVTSVYHRIGADWLLWCHQAGPVLSNLDLEDE
ncbi:MULTISPECIES: YybH family protein [unclassified Nocardioides]|uniref:YybH family protein n=1 Tax=unclassified Nocardioides TaxID=2615069 RepID=UPI0006F38054|nr:MULTISPECIES: nuclear transport factor 2 family protein [unclassified Nocardioides]KQY50224.1 hypothetical protein ASD30_22175 [Nocardioides sp. Root140]KRF14920.1 hypothetical protein ASH02_11690 [Nocardioides sp. Soil796]